MNQQGEEQGQGTYFVHSPKPYRWQVRRVGEAFRMDPPMADFVSEEDATLIVKALNASTLNGEAIAALEAMADVLEGKVQLPTPAFYKYRQAVVGKARRLVSSLKHREG